MSKDLLIFTVLSASLSIYMLLQIEKPLESLDFVPTMEQLRSIHTKAKG